MTDGRATLYAEATQTKKASFKDGDESIDADVVLFNIEGWHGGNGSRQFLAVFQQNTKKDWPEEWGFNDLQLIGFMKVGEDYERSFRSISIAGNLIKLIGLRWENDAHCCPTKPTSAVFRFSRASIVEVAR